MSSVVLMLFMSVIAGGLMGATLADVGNELNVLYNSSHLNGSEISAVIILSIAGLLIAVGIISLIVVAFDYFKCCCEVKSKWRIKQ